MTIHLREIQRTDITEINRWRSDKKLVDFLGANFRFINEEVDEKWFDHYLSSRSNNIRLSICDTISNKLLGVIYLLQIDWLNRSCEYAIQIGETTSHGRGIGYIATTKILDHAFYDLNLNRVHLTVLENNERAIRLYKKIGFVEEGKHRNAVFKNGSYMSLTQMSILSDEYQSFHANVDE